MIFFAIFSKTLSHLCSIKNEINVSVKPSSRWQHAICFDAIARLEIPPRFFSDWAFFSFLLFFPFFSFSPFSSARLEIPPGFFSDWAGTTHSACFHIVFLLLTHFPFLAPAVALYVMVPYLDRVVRFWIFLPRYIDFLVIDNDIVIDFKC